MEENGKYCYKYWRPAVTVDNVVFAFDGKHLNTLLIQSQRAILWILGFPGRFC